MRKILKEQPDMLRYYGMDPDVVSKELAESDAKVFQISNLFDTKM